MIAILCHPHDEASVWLAGTLRRLGVRGLELVSVEQLVFSRSIVHRITSEGDTGAIRLADGRLLRSEAIIGLVNRVQYLPTQHFEKASAADRAYATAELSAFMLAWLNGIAGRVINPPRPMDLGGGTFEPSALMQLASAAGLPTASWRADTSRDESTERVVQLRKQTVVVLDGRVFGPLLTPPLQEGCRRLATLLGVPLLEVRFGQRPDGPWQFARASGVVDFRMGGRSLAMAVARALEVAVTA